MSSGSIFVWETLGTAVLILMGAGVVANVVLKDTLGNAGGWLLINLGWGFAVFAGASIAAPSGAHLNPAVTLGLAIADKTPWDQVPVYFAGQLVGAFLGAVLAWAAYRKHYDQPEVAGTQLGTFSTGPAIKSTVDNLVTEIIATFVLIYIILRFGDTPSQLGPLAVALLVVAIGASLGGPTGYAINPARDLGPRIAHAVLPIRGKGSSDWGYAWVPVVGPLIGGALGGLASVPLLPM